MSYVSRDAENRDEEIWIRVVAEDRKEAQHLTPAVKLMK